MAEEVVYKQEFSVIRNIEDIELKPGSNEISIHGLTPTTDESSIKIDGKGSATITEMMVELVPNRGNFDDIYPDSSEDEESDGGDDDDKDDSDAESEDVKALVEEKNTLEDAVKKAREEKGSASSRLIMLEGYARSTDKDGPQDLEDRLSTYCVERRKVFEVHFASENKIKMLENQQVRVSKKLAKARHDTKTERAKEAKAKMRDIEKKRQIKKEKLETKHRLKQERVAFWPRKTYRVVLTLDTNSDLTPGSSRRGSIDGLAKSRSEVYAESSRISLSLSYITHSAGWTPRYDLSLDTPNNIGQMIYRAEFCNTTSEVWRDTKVILSTSQTSFSGLKEAIPSMQPWHIRLGKQTFGTVGDTTTEALFSKHELDFKRGWQHLGSHEVSEPRSALFGVDSIPGSLSAPPPILPPIQQMMQGRMPPQPQEMQQHQEQSAYQHQMQQARMQQAYQQQQAQASSLFGSSNRQNAQQLRTAVNLFGNTAGSASVPSGSSNTAMASGFGAGAGGEDSLQFYSENPGIAETIVPDIPSLATQESEWSETGMTATYDIPGARTIAPSQTMRRHKIASISLKDIHLSYILVPKLRAAAFLKARIRNTSNITLLKGPVGLTLDGSFLGNASLPRCSPGEPFRLSLGVDPSVMVTYSKPTVKRSQSGVFQKEGSGVYTRTITITNTKSKAIEGLVLDQIPVSEDERLKVEILEPAGLRSEGDSVKTGTGIPAVGKVTEIWGTARATLKKGGEVCWNFNIKPSRGVKLVLEYEARFPSTETVVGC